ncbi:phosphoribosylanthranilate isomerase [Bacillus cereus]|uniref:phosphoribosylanthranilate isomerase n=1 Tax=Bacillus TaxID=1386 RepID=UPI0005523150|nr:phosphoribosylanthranilate isomerase [Bacillus sp. UNC322MFChir4.1]
MPLIKICGIRTYKEALAAVSLGANAIGFVFSSSKRQVDSDTVKEIISKLPPFTNAVGVFVDEEIEKVNEIAKYCGLTYVQLHGVESPEYCSKINVPVIKTIKVKSEEDIYSMKKYNTYAFVLDSFVQGQSGGTGKVFDWNLATKASEYGNVILAGGLTPENLLQAIKKIRPLAVDVSSGVEKDGMKDMKRMYEFVKICQKYNIQKVGMSESCYSQ